MKKTAKTKLIMPLLSIILAISLVLNVYFIAEKNYYFSTKKIPNLIKTKEVYNKELLNSVDSLTTVLSTINYAYYKDIPESTLFHYAIKGILENLDPYSAYLEKDQVEHLTSYTKGEFYGIGIEITQREDKTIEIVSPIEGSPAIKAGILSGDTLSLINGEPVLNMNLIEVSRKLRGKNGSKINLTFLRGNKKYYTVSLERKLIVSPSVTSALYDDILYISVSNFNEKTTADLKKEIIHAKAQGLLKGLILDLRNNPGGLLTQAISVADLFLNGGKIISLKHKYEKNEEIYLAEKGDILNGLPLLILINKGSASAAEIVAGSLKDNNRAIIAGNISFGKGMVQSVIPINNLGDEIKLTTGLYYLPKGNTIQDVGIIPDLFIFADGTTCKNCSTEELNLLQKKENAYFLDMIEAKETLAEDYQLQKAIEILRKYS